MTMLNIERFYSWEAVTRSGRKYSSGLLNNGNRGGYDALPHAELEVFEVWCHTHIPEPGQNGGLDLNLVGAPLVTIHLAPDEKIIYRRRAEMAAAGGKNDPTSLISIGRGSSLILVGATRHIKDRVAHRLNWIVEATGQIHCTAGFTEDDGRMPRDVRSWFYSPTIRAHEVP